MQIRGKLNKTIKDAGSKFDDYSISPKIRQELTENKSCKKQKKDILKRSCWVLFKKQTSNKRKVKESIPKLIKRWKRQD